MRWSNLQIQQGTPAAPLPLAMPEAVARTFETPEFRGITCYEVRAKSILNQVPAASAVPFRWTLNPYRGCTHACTYCLAGDTRIEMADGSTKLLERVRIGDQVFGTEVRGSDRRYVKTTVLAHWSTAKPAYRVTLNDGTRLVASGDHRFLTDQGWKHVARRPDGRGRHPYLVAGSSLMGVGRFADGPVEGVAVTSAAALGVAAVEPLGVDLELWDITTGSGDFVAEGVVSHNCFARNTHTYLDLDYGHDFDSRIVVKVNAPELLRKELGAKSWRGEHVAMGTNVDPYQRAEGKYRLMRGVLTALRDYRNPFSILTKGTLVLRDLDLLTDAAQLARVSVSVSVGFVDHSLWRQVEPGTPSPRARLGVCRSLVDAGIGCGVLMAPILPFLTDTDDQLEATVAAIADAGAESVTPLVLHLRPGAREWFLGWLRGARPDLVARYARLYSRGAYAPREYTSAVAGRVKELAQRYGIGTRTAAQNRLRPPAVSPPATRTEPAEEQLSLISIADSALSTTSSSHRLSP